MRPHLISGIQVTHFDIIFSARTPAATLINAKRKVETVGTGTLMLAVPVPPARCRALSLFSRKIIPTYPLGSEAPERAATPDVAPLAAGAKST